MKPSILLALLGFGILCAASTPTSAEDFVRLGYREDTVLEGEGSRECHTGTSVYNHDYSFENCYCWQDTGVVPPYYGAFAEGFQAAPATQVYCVMYWLTQIGDYTGQTMDCYVWEGGFLRPSDGGVVRDAVGRQPAHLLLAQLPAERVHHGGCLLLRQR